MKKLTNRQRRKENREQRQREHLNCEFCNKTWSKLTPISHRIAHPLKCTKNPKNLIVCPVCKTKFFPGRKKKQTTCSVSCSNTHFRTGEGSPNWKAPEDRTCRTSLYRFICFTYHPKECLICGEKGIVEVHHFDLNHENNRPRNLVPLCPTHHKYMHKRSCRILIIAKVREYRKAFNREWRGKKINKKWGY
jgi:hypothetical protein